MIGIEVEFLTGRYVASSFADRSQPEWPPHPARLFSALVATAADDEPEDFTRSREVLCWLEEQPPPWVQASEADPRTALSTYVPGNHRRSLLGDWSTQQDALDSARVALQLAEGHENAKATQQARKEVKLAEEKLRIHIARALSDQGNYEAAACDKARELLPEYRGRLPRCFPSVTPLEPKVRYIWPEASPPPDLQTALHDLLLRVVRLGHSSSLVSCRLLSGQFDGGQFNGWVPSEDGEQSMRVATKGQVLRLEAAHARYRGVEPRVLPAHHQRYRRQTSTEGKVVASSMFAEWIVFRETPLGEGRRLELRPTRVADLTRALRTALLSHCDTNSAETLSGHTSGGVPLTRPHVAFVALPEVGSPYSNGTILGSAMILPRDLGEDERLSLFRTIGQWDGRVRLNNSVEILLERVVDGDPRVTLAPHTWIRPSRLWASVTPVALDENPGHLSARDSAAAEAAALRAQAIISRSCTRIGLPPPVWVQVMPRSLFTGIPAARKFMPFSHRGSTLMRVCVHAEICFAEPVQGPILLGAGRYLGLGLFRPRWEPA